MVTLGLDASTTCVGYAFTKDKKILDMGFIDIKKETTPQDKVQKVLEFINNSPYIDDVNDIQEIKLNILMNQKRAADLGDQILKVCASGRKKCPFCSLPKNQDGTCDGKPCVKKNGHMPLI